jgi:hypothetical protein
VGHGVRVALTVLVPDAEPVLVSLAVPVALAVPLAVPVALTVLVPDAEPVLVPLAVRVALAVPLTDALIDGGGTHAHDSVNEPPPVPALNGATSTSNGPPKKTPDAGLVVKLTATLLAKPHASSLPTHEP